MFEQGRLVRGVMCNISVQDHFQACNNDPCGWAGSLDLSASTCMAGRATAGRRPSGPTCRSDRAVRLPHPEPVLPTDRSSTCMLSRRPQFIHQGTQLGFSDIACPFISQMLMEIRCLIVPVDCLGIHGRGRSGPPFSLEAWIISCTYRRSPHRTVDFIAG